MSPIPESNNALVYTALTASVFLGASVLCWRSRSRQQHALTEDIKETVDPNKLRANGEWTPVKFQYPRVTPQLQRLQDIKPIPYRPIRWGKYNVTMGIRPMPWNDWIELDQEFPRYHEIRRHRIQTRGRKVVNILLSRPGLVSSGHEAAYEYVQELSEYLSWRYPTTFLITRHDSGNLGWEGLPRVKDISIPAVNATYLLDPNGNMMAVAALLVQEDIAIMIEGTDGRYYFQAGAICVAGSWRLEDKIGLPLDEIHTDGNVPQYREKLQMSMERFFKRLPVDKPVTRNNFFFQIIPSPSSSMADEVIVDPEELGWSATTNGPEDNFDHRHATTHPRSRPHVTPDTLRFRTERQTLRRLPRTGAVVFGIRTYVVPVTELAEEPGVPGRMASALRSWPDDVAGYKGKDLYENALLEYLDECHLKQVEAGLWDEEIPPNNTHYPL